MVAEMSEQKDGIVIGIEVHCQLNRLRTKLFCGCSTDYRGKDPNTNVCEVCLGHPGSLPRPNARAVELAVMVGIALNSTISEKTSFYRKNYYYVDMGKNFQISMYETKGSKTICEGGFIDINVGSSRKRVRITRIQLEEDPAKLVHVGPIDLSPYTLVDYNRAGMALLEIVTEPDMTSPREARLFLQKLRSILEHIGAFDGGLEGAMRCDANISIAGGTRVEIKNISSFKEVERALNFEISRQRSLLEKGERVRRETRHWDEVRKVTISLREKEEEHDYRYFPEPDIPPIRLDAAYVGEIRARMPELPDARAERFVREYNLPQYDAQVLTAEKRLADFFEESVKIHGEAKTVSNWIMSDLLGVLHDKNMDLEEARITPETFAGMLSMIKEGKISGKIGKIILPTLVTTGRSAEEVVRENDLARIADREAIERVVEEVFAENRKAVSDALSDEKAAHFLVGQVMRKTRGKGDPELVNRCIRERLERMKNSGGDR